MIFNHGDLIMVRAKGSRTELTKGRGKGSERDDQALWEAVKASAVPVQRDTVFRDGLTETTLSSPPLKPQQETGQETGQKPGYKTGKTSVQTAEHIFLKDLPEPKSSHKLFLGPDLHHGCSPGVDKRTADRLKKGRMDIEDRLDLHGMSREAAHRATSGFITSARLSGKRCVLIVTGKGKGILQSELPRWLNMPEMRSRILSFSHARPKDGGTGAVYVLLKRDRRG
jgi:DNA-nicking Smr family endonuclease